MMTNEKAVPGVCGTEDGKMERTALAGASIPIPYYSTQRGRVASVLSYGRENAITGHEIMQMLALKDGREVSALVERERQRGFPICATCNSERPGYYLPETPEELQAYNRSLRRRIKNVTATLDAMELTLDNWTGQMMLDLSPGGDGVDG